MNGTEGGAPPRFELRLNSSPTYWHCEPGWEWRARPLSDHLLWYVMDGMGNMRVDGQSWPLQGGSCFVFRPGTQPHGTQEPDRRLVVFGMHFDMLDAQERLLHETSEILPPYGHTVRDTAFWALLAQHCDTSWRRGDALGYQQSCLYLRALILQVWEEVLHPAPSAVDLAVTEILRQIQMEPGKHWSVDELARRAHLSRAQFGRRFRAATVLAPMRFIVQVRLDRARQLVQETTMTLGQIAAVLGYDDLSFFSRQYKAYAGHAPSTLRRPAVEV